MFKNFQLLKKILLLSIIIFFSIHPASSSVDSIQSFYLPVILKNNSYALVYVFRSDDFFSKNYPFKIYLNNPDDSDMMIGETKGREYIFFQIKQGKYTIYSKADNVEKILLNIENGKTYFIKQISLPGYNALNKLELVDYEEAIKFIEKSKQGSSKVFIIN